MVCCHSQEPSCQQRWWTPSFAYLLVFLCVVALEQKRIFPVLVSAEEHGNRDGGQQQYGAHYHTNRDERWRNHVGKKSESAYDILGLDPSRDLISDEAIRKRYRKLCLQYHPDKNVNRSEKERQLCEKRFKDLQEAYSKIGTKESRRNYNLQIKQGPWQHYSDRYQRPQSPWNTAYRPAKSTCGGQTHYGRPRPGFFTGSYYSPFAEAANKDTRKSMPKSGDEQRPRYFVRSDGATNSWQTDSLPEFSYLQPARSRYKYTVKITLEDLYNGKMNMTFYYPYASSSSRRAAHGNQETTNNLKQAVVTFFVVLRSYWERVVAAVRCWDLSKVLARLLFLLANRAGYLAPFIMLFANVGLFFAPLPEEDTYVVNIPAGCKGETEFVFPLVVSMEPSHARDYYSEYDGRSEVVSEMVFVVQEKKHKVFQRVGYNLHTTQVLSKKKARQGCQIKIPTLERSERNSSNHDSAHTGTDNDQDQDEDKQHQKSLLVTLPPNFVRHNGQSVTLRGRGWPYNPLSLSPSDASVSTLQKGDLVVTFQLED